VLVATTPSKRRSYQRAGIFQLWGTRPAADLIVLDTLGKLYAHAYGLVGGRVLSSRIATGIDSSQTAPQL
jgi:hypothetical protein